MAEGDADDAGLGVLDDPDGGQDGRLAFLGVLARDGAKDLGAFRAGELDVVALVADLEGGGDAGHDGVRGLGHGERELAVAVATGATADELVVVLGLERPVVPGGGVQEDDALPCPDEVADGLLELRRTELAVVAAEQEEVGLREELEGLLEVRGRGDVVAGGLGDLAVGPEEELREVMRAAGAGHEDAELAGLAGTELLAGRGGGAGVVGREVAILDGRALRLGLTGSGRRRRGLGTLGRVRGATDLGGDGHGGRGDGVARARQDDLLDHFRAIDRDDQGADVVGLDQTGGDLGTGDLRIVRVVVGEIATSVVRHDLLAATDEADLDVLGGEALDAGPAADGTEEVQAGGGDADGDLDALREGLGVGPTGAALEDDDVLAVLGLGRVEDDVRHPVGGDLAELRERQGVALGLAGGVQTPAGVGGHRGREVEQLEAADGQAVDGHGHAAEVGDDVAEAFGTEGFEAFGHERGLDARAGGDVGHLDLDGRAAGHLQLQGDGVFAADEGLVLGAVLELNVPGAVLVIDHAVGVDDVHEEFGGGVRADALEVGADIITDVADLVAGLAGGDEEFLALGGVAGLLDLGAELVDDVVLGGAGADVELGQDLGRALGDGGFGVAGELGGLERPELHRGDVLGLELGQDQLGPFGAADEGAEEGLAQETGGLAQGTGEERAGLDVTGGDDGGDDREADGLGRGLVGQRGDDGGAEGRTEVAQRGQRAASLQAHGRGGRGVGEDRDEALTDREQVVGEGGDLVPLDGEAGGAGGELEVGRGEQGLERLGVGDGGGAAFGELAQDDLGDGDVAALGSGGQHAGDALGLVGGRHGGRERAGELHDFLGGDGAGEEAFEGRDGVGRGSSGGGGLGPLIGELGLGREEQQAGVGGQRGGAHRTEGGQADAAIGVSERGLEGGGRERELTGLGDEEGVLAQGGFRRGGDSGERRGGELAETLERPEGLDAGLDGGAGGEQGGQRSDGGGLRGVVAVEEDADRVEADDLAGVRERGDEAGGVRLGEVGVRLRRGGVMLDAVDTAEVVLAVGADRGAGLGVLRAAGVVVRDDRGVEVEDVHRAVGAEGDVDRAEPVVSRAEPFLVLEHEFAAVERAVEHELLVVDDVEDGLGHPHGAVIFLGPGAPFIDGGGAAGGVMADLVDLHQRGAVRQVGAGDRTTAVDGIEGLGGRARGLGEDLLREDDVLDGVTVGGLAVVELHVARDLVAEAVAAERGDLLDGGAVGLETEGAGGEAGHRLAGLGVGRRAAAAVGGVDPAVGGDDEVVGDEVGVARGEATVEEDFLVGLAVAVGVAEPEDALLRDDDDAVFPDAETGDQLEAFVEDLLLVEVAVALGADEDRDLVLGGAVIETGHQHAAFLPRLGVQGAAAVGVLGGLRDPEAATFVPLDGDGLVDEGFGDDRGGLEAGLQAELRDGVGGTARAAHGVTEIGQVGRGAELVEVGALGDPSDAALEEGVDAGVTQGGRVALEQDDGAVGRGLEHPGLRLDVVDGGATGLGLAAGVGDLGGEGGGEDVVLLVQGEIEDRVILDVEGRHALDERVRVGADVEHGRRAELLALGRPTAAEVVAAPVGGATGDRAVHDDETVTGLGEVGQGLLGGGVIGGELGLVKEGDVHRGEVGRERGRGALHLRPTLTEAGGEIGADGVLVADDQDPERSGGKGRDGEDQGQTQEVAEAG